MSERLKEARKRAGFASATAAVEALGIEYPTYAAHENGSRAFDAKSAALYARKFKVSLDWLIAGRGDGAMLDGDVVKVVGYLGAGAEVEPDFEQVPPEGLKQVGVPFPLPDDMIAFEVRGTSMLPQYKDGSIIIVFREQQRPLDAFFGEEAAVRTEDGRRFIKTIMRGSVPNTVNLISWNAPPIESVRLAWIGEIFSTIAPSALRRVERKGGIQGRLRLKSG